MLKLLKKMERTRNFVLILFAVLLVVSLIVFGAMTGGEQQQATYDADTVAQVGNENITVSDLVTIYQRASRNSRQPIPANFLLNNQIEEKLVGVEAKRLGLTASDAEVADEIRKYFTQNGNFDQKNYERIATREGGSVSAYENRIRGNISARKLTAFITSSVTASEEEILKKYKRTKSKFNLTYVPISTAEVVKNINPSDEELKEYFEKNKKSYYINSPQKKIRYIYLETAKVGEKLEFSDEELKEEYDKLPEDKKIAGVNVQEIVLQVSDPKLKTQVATKANNLASDLKKEGETVSEEKFAEVAKGQSERPATATNGGRIKGLVRKINDPNKQDDPYQKVLNLKEGEVTDPIEYGSSFYILRRGKAVPKNFEDAKKELLVSRQNKKAYDANSALSKKVSDRLKEEKDVKKVAEEFAEQANMNVEDMVRETDYVKPGDEIDKFGVSQDFEQGIAELKETNDVGNNIPVPGGFAIPLLVDKKEPRDAEFEEVKDKVLETVKKDQARKKVEEIAEKIAENTESPDGLNAAAKNEKLEAKTAKDFVLGSPLGEGPTAMTSETLEDTIFGLKKGEVTKKPVKVGDIWYVVGLNDRQEADMENFPKERDQIAEQMLNQKRNQVFIDYVAAARQRMEKSGEIKIYKKALSKVEKFIEENKPQTPQLTPQQRLQQQIQQQLQRQQQQQQSQP